MKGLVICGLLASIALALSICVALFYHTPTVGLSAPLSRKSNKSASLHTSGWQVLSKSSSKGGRQASSTSTHSADAATQPKHYGALQLSRRTKIVVIVAVVAVVLLAVLGILLWQFVFASQLPQPSTEGSGGNIHPGGGVSPDVSKGYFEERPWMIGVIVAICLIVIGSGMVSLGVYKHRQELIRSRANSSQIELPVEENTWHFTEPSSENIIGRGATSTVYLVHDLRNSNLRYAFKVLTGGFDKANKEIELLKAAAGHQNIMSAPEWHGTRSRWSGYVMEYLEFGSLDALALNLRLNEEDLPIISYIARCVLSGLEHLHSRGLAHRDIKPENLGANADMVIKIVDFGFSKRLDEDMDDYCGSLPFMAPEVLSRDPNLLDGRLIMTSHVSSSCDIYSLGMTLTYFIDRPRNLVNEAGKLIFRNAVLNLVRNSNDENSYYTFEDKIVSFSLVEQPVQSPYKEFFDFLKKCLILRPENRPPASELLAEPFIRDYVGQEDTIKARLRNRLVNLRRKT